MKITRTMIDDFFQQKRPKRHRPRNRDIETFDGFDVGNVDGSVMGPAS